MKDTLWLHKLLDGYTYSGFMLLSTKRWAHYTALICTLNSLFLAFPSYQKIFTDDPKVNDYLSFWNRINEQADHPLTVFVYPPASHEAKVSFRLLAPLLARFSPFESLNYRMAYLFLLQHIAGFFFFYFLALFAFRYTQDRATSSLFALMFSMTYLGHCFFYELYGFFDGIAFTLFLVSMYYYQKWFCAIPFFLAFWIDERAVIGSGLVFLFIISHDIDFSRRSVWMEMAYKSRPLLVAYIAYFVFRRYLEIVFSLAVPIGTEYDAGVGLIFKQARTIPLATFLSYEGIWLIFLLGSVVLWFSSSRLFLSLYLLVFTFIMIVSFSVWDVTRSIMYGFPFMLVCAKHMFKAFSPKQNLLICMIVLVLNFMIPSYKNHCFLFYWQIPLPVKVIYYMQGQPPL
jgi:hypothetical protein